MDDLTAADLFSPSKARQQRAQAQDWAQIESWLSFKYHPRSVPQFERNDETLKILRELSTANERADEDRAIQQRLEREALAELDETTPDAPNGPLITSLTTNLPPSGVTALHALASTATLLSTAFATPETLAHALIQHTAVSQTLTNQLAHIQTLRAYLENQHALLRAQLADLKTNAAFTASPGLHRQTTEHVRQTKHLRGKIREHEDRLATLQGQVGLGVGLGLGLGVGGGKGGANSSVSRGVDIGSAESIEEMLERAEELDALETDVEGLEAQVDVYRGLPADREAARKEVGRLEVELDGVRKRRDALFEGLVAR